MARASNRLRKRLRPADPKDLDFQLMEDCIPEGFFQADVYVKERRRLIFATLEQLINVSFLALKFILPDCMVVGKEVNGMKEC